MKIKVKLLIFALLSSLSFILFLLFPTLSQAQPTNNVTYDGSSFSPTSITIELGDNVEWTNNSSSFIEIASNPHPIHTEYPPLNLGLVQPNGGAVSLTFNEIGTFGYHNHLNETQTGEIVVTDAAATPTVSSSPIPTSQATITPQPTNTHTPCNTPGDSNNDCLVSKSDYVYWLFFLVNPVLSAIHQGDYNSDGFVNGIDYVIWLINLIT